MADGNTLLGTAKLIDTYIRYRDHLKAKADEFALSMKPYNDAMTLIEGQILADLNSRSEESVRTEAGTAYKTTHTSVKVENREVWLQYLFSLIRDDDLLAAEFITNHIGKEAVKTYMEGNNGMLPPGILIDRVISVNFRRA